MGREEERRATELGEGGGGFDDAVAEGLQDAPVQRGEDRVLEDDVVDAVVCACGVPKLARTAVGLGVFCVCEEGGCQYVGARVSILELRARRMRCRSLRSDSRDRDRRTA